MKFYTNVVQMGDSIHVRGYENGRAFTTRVKYEPKLFVPSKKESEWKTMHGEPVSVMEFASISDAHDFIMRYEEIENFRIYGQSRFMYAYLNEEYPGEIRFDPALIRIANIDIEVASRNGFAAPEFPTEEITAITVFKDNKFYAFACGDYKPSDPDVIYFPCDDERQLLLSFIDEWSRGGYPDAMTGWNISGYDIPYLVNRVKMVLGSEHANKLSPFKKFTSRTAIIQGRKMNSMAISGIACLDYLELYRKFTYKQQDSYKLDNIAFVELGDKKVDYKEYGSLQNLYEKNFKKFMDYNIHDVRIVNRLEEKMGLLDLALTLAYDAKVNYADVFSQVRMWDSLIHNHLWKSKIVIPHDTSKGSKDAAYEGAYVKAPMVGLHNWVVSFDLDALYPHLIMQYNIGPDTILNKHVPVTVDQLLDESYSLKIENDIVLAPNGWCFSKKRQGFLAEMMETMYKSRSAYKKLMLEAKKNKEAAGTKEDKDRFEKEASRCKNMQMAKKIQLNSAYGAIGNQYFRYYDLRQATAITIAGQLSIRWIENKMNSYLNKILKTTDVDYVIASDTDSIYINFEPIVKQTLPEASTSEIVNYIDKLCEKAIQPKIEAFYEQLCSRMNAYAQKMHMKREVIASRGVWTAKKRYFLSVWDSEGVRYKEPDLKIMGLEAIKSSTPLACRDAIKEVLKLVISSDEEAVQKYIQDFRVKFNKMSFEEIAFPRGVSEIESFTLNSPSLPIHVRGSLIYNRALLNRKQLANKYPKIKDGDKIKFCYLKTPNHMQSNVIASPGELPKEFDMDQYIDYDTQFDKAFLAAIRPILQVVGWNEKHTPSLEDFFA